LFRKRSLVCPRRFRSADRDNYSAAGLAASVWHPPAFSAAAGRVADRSVQRLHALPRRTRSAPSRYTKTHSVLSDTGRRRSCRRPAVRLSLPRCCCRLSGNITSACWPPESSPSSFGSITAAG
jgi:hypothetical protein